MSVKHTKSLRSTGTSTSSYEASDVHRAALDVSTTLPMTVPEAHNKVAMKGLALAALAVDSARFVHDFQVLLLVIVVQKVCKPRHLASCVLQAACSQTSLPSH